MFERARVDNASKSPVACELIMDDGRELSGHLLVTSQRGLVDELNATGGFAEFEQLDRTRCLLAKSTIRAARPATFGKVDHLQQNLRENAAFDPHAILGIPRSADRETIRRAYHTLAKAYHPDRMQGIDLPQEIVDYATAMAKRINAAYSSLNGAEATRAAPAARAPEAAAR